MGPTEYELAQLSAHAKVASLRFDERQQHLLWGGRAFAWLAAQEVTLLGVSTASDRGQPV